MAIVDLKNVLKIFGGSEPTAEEKTELYKEVLLMTLARAASADSNMKPVEVETVRNAVSREIGQEVSVSEVRVAGSSSLYETTPLDRYLAKAATKLSQEQCVNVASALSEVIQSDLRVSPFEIEFFDMVAKALNLTPADLAGLTTGSAS